MPTFAKNYRTAQSNLGVAGILYFESSPENSLSHQGLKTTAPPSSVTVSVTTDATAGDADAAGDDRDADDAHTGDAAAGDAGDADADADADAGDVDAGDAADMNHCVDVEVDGGNGGGEQDIVEDDIVPRLVRSTTGIVLYYCMKNVAMVTLNVAFCVAGFLSRAGVDSIPDHLSHSYKRMWCTHGITQASRGEGLRDAQLRYTGCEASFVVRAVKIVKRGNAKWQVCVDENIDLTPQQTRNVLRQVLGSSTLERTKNILDTFAEEDAGNDVLLVQDQLDITCVIAMQTSIQKACFEQWRDTLVMDWTHGTNNLGYHLLRIVLPNDG
ncbi:unnamed protein product [Phytophthora fragariaefolia]|uniref:Unnamed protein product n=1 Tax=Phytophthora fragariaefolia TaxID=1490495 RepID=A0A9W6X387_9STRA|nr:unnamed protein product [Phytophthora fragariaefolia]